jgi:hypothetical protein
MLEIMFLLSLAVVISVVLWYRSFEEFTILQFEWSPSLVVPDERVPIVIRKIPAEYSALWNSALAKQSSLPLLLSDNRRSVLKEYAESPTVAIHSLNQIELAAKFHLHDRFKDTMMWLQKFWYLPVSVITSPARLSVIPSISPLGLQRSLAERTVITVHEGTALVWLCRETLPTKEIQMIHDKNPWALSAKAFPFITELQYVEVRLRAGNCLVLPPRSLWALKSEGDPVYYSTIELNSALSLFISSISKS